MLTLIVLTLLVVGATLLSGENTGMLLGSISIAVFVGPIAIIVFALGIAVLGGPTWALLHGLGFRNWPYAMMLGALLCGVVVALLEALMPSNHSLILWQAPLFAAIGAVSGLVVWRIAYRRADEPHEATL